MLCYVMWCCVCLEILDSSLTSGAGQVLCIFGESSGIYAAWWGDQDMPVKCW